MEEAKTGGPGQSLNSIWAPVSQPHGQHSGWALPEHTAHPAALCDPSSGAEWVSEILQAPSTEQGLSEAEFSGGCWHPSPLPCFPVPPFPRPQGTALLLAQSCEFRPSPFTWQPPWTMGLASICGTSGGTWCSHPRVYTGPPCSEYWGFLLLARSQQ